MLLIWTIGVFAMWLRAHLTMKARDQLRKGIAGKNRAVLELASTMQKELGLQNAEPQLLRESDLKARYTKKLTAVPSLTRIQAHTFQNTTPRKG